MIEGITALYIFMLSAFTGYEVIGRVPVILHTPLMSGSNFIHGIVLVGAMVTMGHAHGTLELIIAGKRPAAQIVCFRVARHILEDTSKFPGGLLAITGQEQLDACLVGLARVGPGRATHAAARSATAGGERFS